MEIVGYVAGILTLLGYLPQTIKTIRTRQTRDLSLLTFLVIGASALSWVGYGVATSQPEIWVTNGVVSICSITILVMKLRHG